MGLPISVLIMTQNEELNIKYALESVIDDFDQVIVTDSFGTDKTVEICKRYPAVELYQNRFDGWAEQRNWMLQNCNIRNEIVFFLDADEYVEKDFVDELWKIISDNHSFSAILLKEKFIFLGKHIKYAHAHPLVKRIFKKDHLYFFSEYKGAPREHGIALNNKTIKLSSSFIHFDRRSVSSWIEKHNKYSDVEAKIYFQRKREPKQIAHALSKKLKIKLWIRNYLWNKMPLLIRPFCYFIYRYLFLLGFLDGKEGFVLCFLQSFWYQSLIDIKIIEKKIKNNIVS